MSAIFVPDGLFSRLKLDRVGANVIDPSTLPEALWQPGDIPILLKRDFARLTAVSDLNALNDNELVTSYSVNVHYNVILLALGINNLQFCYDGGAELGLIELKSVCLEEKLSVREQQIINSIRGFLSWCQKNDRELHKYEISRTKNSSLPFDEIKGTSFNANSLDFFTQLLKNFPELNRKQGKIYLYSHQVFSSLQAGLPVNDLPLAYGIFENLEHMSVATPQAGHKNFREHCHKLILDKIDPMTVFTRSNLINSSYTENFYNLSDEEKKLLMYFFAAISQPIERGFVDKIRIESDIVERTIYSNFKRISFDLNFHSYAEPANFKIRLLNREVIPQIDGPPSIVQKYIVRNNISDLWQLSINSAIHSKHLRRDPNFPMQFSNMYNPYEKEFIVDNRDAADTSLRHFFCHRTVSLNKINNTPFKCINLDGRLDIDTQDEIDVSAPKTISRNIIINNDSGENFIKSQVTLNDKIGKHFRLENYSANEELVSTISVFGFSINMNETSETRGMTNVFAREQRQNAINANEDDYFAHKPANVIKICNMPEGFRVFKMFCHPISSAESFRMPIPLTHGDIIAHADPIPGVAYRYDFQIADELGNLFTKVISVKIITLPEDYLQVNLTAPHPPTLRPNMGGYWTSVDIPVDQMSLIANRIVNNLKSIFTDDTYANFVNPVEAALNRDLSSLGNTFELKVEFYDKKSGNFVSYPNGPGGTHHAILQPEKVFGDAPDLPEGSAEPPPPPPAVGWRFWIGVPDTTLDLIMNWNLIINNPLDDLSRDEQVIDPESKDFFERKTSKYFGSAIKLSGDLPATIKTEDGREIYVNSDISAGISFSNLVCTGGILDIGVLSPESSITTTSAFTAQFCYDTGDFLLSWQLSLDRRSRDRGWYPDFFIITAVINDLEVPITAFPFIETLITYKVRTCSFLGVCSRVKFKIYIVDSDFNVRPAGESAFHSVSDVRFNGAEVGDSF